MFKPRLSFAFLALLMVVLSGAWHAAFAQSTATAQLPVDVNWVVDSTTQIRIDLGTLGVNQTIDDIVLQATGGQAPYTWTRLAGLANGEMPVGTALSSSGVISGTPTVVKNSTGFKVRVADSAGKSTEVWFTLAVALTEKPMINPPGNGTTLVGVSFSKQMQAISGKKPYTWSTTATLPAGLTLNATTGLLAVTPDSSSVNATANFRVYNIPIKLTTGSNATATANFTLTVTKPFVWVTPSNLPGQSGPGVEQTAGPTCSLSLAVTGGKDPYIFKVQAGSNLPPGLTLSTSGNLSGRPTANGNFSFTVNATDSLGSVIPRSFVIEIKPYTLTMGSGPVTANGTQYIAIERIAYSALNGTTPYKYTASNLPPGLSINATTGYIDGSPTGIAGTSNFTVTATDAIGMTASRTCVFTVNPGTPLDWDIDPLDPGQVGYAYSANLSAATGGWPSYTYSSSGLPAGLTFNATARRVSGTPTTAGNFSVNFTVTDSASPKNSVTRSIPITITPYMTVTGPATASGQQYMALSPVDFNVEGGNGNYTWSTIPTPIVPASLTINASTGIISGNLTAAPGNYTLRVSVRDSTSRNATANITITVQPRPPLEWVTPVKLPSGKVMDAYSENLTVSGGQPAYKFALKTGSTLPAGLVLNNSTGAITGKPTAPGNFTFTVNASDSGNPIFSVERTFEISIAEYGMSIGGPDSISGDQYSAITPATFSPVGGVGNFTWNATWSGNATALTINSASGIVSGNLTTGTGSTTSTPGNYTMVIKLTDGQNQSANKTVTVRILPLTISWVTPATLPDGKELDDYSQTLQTSGGKSPITYSVKTGSALPPGLSLNSTTGIISGKPTADGNYTFTIIAKDSAIPANQSERIFTLKVAPYGMEITGATSASGQQYTALTPVDLNVTGGTAPFTWSTAPALPATLSINSSTGIISGNLTAIPGNTTVVVKVMDANSRNATANFTVTINQRDPVAWITNEELPDGKELDTYSETLEVEGGKAPFTFAVKTGSVLPSGLALNATTGLLSGKPTKEGNYTFTIIATDSGNPVMKEERTFTLYITPYGMEITGATSASGKQYTALTPVDLNVTGGVAPFTWSTSPALPETLSINASTGIISGNLTAIPGNTTVVVKVVDANSRNATANFTVTITPRDPVVWTTSTALPDGKELDAYSQNLTVSGGLAPYKFALQSGALPGGITLNATTGRLSGTANATSEGNYTFTVNASDSGNPVMSQLRTFTLTIAPYGMTVNGSATISGEQFTAISPATYSATGGAAPYKWSATGLPATLSINATSGIVSGNLTAAPGNYTANITVTDNKSQTASKNFAITILPSQLEWQTPATLPNGKVSFAYTQNLSVSGGKPPYTFGLANGSTLPPGLLLNNSTGVISGRPTGNATSNFTITASDSGSPVNTANRTFTLTIDPMDALVWTINPAPASGKVAFAYSANLSAASGGSGNYSYSANASTLPPGLSFNATTRTISGTPTASGNFNVSLTVRDNFGNATAAATLANATVQTIPITIEPYGLGSNGTSSIVGYQYTAITPVTFAPIGGIGNYTWLANSTTGLTINSATGVISGNLTAAPGNYTMVVSVRDGRNQTATANVSVQIRAIELAWVTQPLLPSGKVATAYTTNLTVSGGRPTYTYALKNGSALPAGLTLNTTTGIISGKPTSASSAGNTTIVTVSTLAGSGSPSYADGQGIEASFNLHTGVAVDGGGNVYVADFSNNRIRKISPGGIVTTLAGSGNAGYADGQGTAASFYSPNGVAADAAGNVYVTDPGNNRIRKISSSGIVTTLAGSGTAGFIDAQGTGASFNSPSGIAVDASGNVYVADRNNHRIRKISPSGNVTTLAGSGTAGYADGQGTSASFSSPRGVAVDANGNVYAADRDNHRVRKISPDGIVTTLAGSGTAGSANGQGSSASFNSPREVAVDASGYVYVADANNHQIRKISPSGDVSTLAGSGSPGSANGNYSVARFSAPQGVAVDASGNVYVADTANNLVRKIAPEQNGEKFTVIARDSGNPQNTAEREFILPINPYGMTVNGTASITGLQYSSITPTTFNAVGGTANYTWSANSTTGLTINATTGVVSGNLTAAPGNYTMIVSVRDGANQTASANVSVTIQPLTLSWVTEPTLPDGQVASAYTTNLTVSGGRPPYGYVLANGSALPTGLTLNATTGVLSGSPTVAGNYTFTINASDSAVPKYSANRTFTLRVMPYPMTITGPDLIAGQKFLAITPVTYVGANGNGTYKWSMNSTTGLTINATTGVVSGIPTAVAGNYTANITLTDSKPQSVTKQVAITILPVTTLAWTTTSPLPSGQVAFAYTTSLAVSGGRPGYTYALSNNSTLPAGLTLNATTGVISGTPAAAGTSNITITASDSDAPTKNSVSQLFALTIAPYGMTINGSDTITGKRYSTITPTPYLVVGGNATYTWSANNTTGLTINATTGIVRGNLTALPGNYTLPVSVRDGRNQTVTKNVLVSISEPDPLAWVTPEKLQGGRVSLDYTQTLSATGGRSPYTYVLKTGPMPAGLSLNSTTGLISGKPATAGTSNFTLTLRDAANGTVDRTFNLVIEPYGMGIVGTSPLEGKRHQYFEYRFGVEGGRPSYTWNATAAPTGLTMNATSGVLSGTPSATGNFTTVIRVRDGGNQSITRTFIINISAPDAISIVSGPNFGPLSINSTYTTGLRALGGNGNYTWSILAPKPASVNLTPTGVLTANSTTALTANFTVRVQDTLGANATRAMSVVFFNPATLVIATDSLYTGWVGEEYSVQLGALGGTPPYDWALTSGTLPAGMNLSETGCIYGTPTTSANTTLTFRVTDSKGLTANKTLALTIQGKPGDVAASGKLFTDVTNAANLSLPEHYIIAVEDFDNDGREDLLATNSASNVVLMRGVGAFDFRDITANAGLNGVAPALVADFNNDGVSDILSVNLQRTEATLFLNNGQGVFTRQALTGLLTGDLANYRDISYADVDGDGDIDLLFNINATTGGGVVAIFNQANVSQTASPLFSGKSYLVKTTWRNAKFSVTDANGDGKQDLVVVQTNGNWPNDTHRPQRASLYLNTGNTTADYANATGAKTLAGFTEKLNCGITSSSEMSAFTSLDIDNDGDLDLLNGSSDWPWAGSIPRIYINDGAGTYTQQDSPILHGRFYHHGATVFDADLDGDQDAVWSALHVFSDVYPRMWENGATYLKASGNGTLDPAKAFFDSTTAWGIDAKISGSGNMGSAGYAADLDADGDLDYIANLWSSNRTYKVYRNDSNLRSANWLKVELIGAVSPAQGTGARVEVELNNATAARPAQAATGSRYEIVIGSFTWQQAKLDAEKRGGHLVTMSTEQEWSDVKALILAKGGSNTYWGGATDEVKSGDWKWIDGTAVTLNKWSAYEPNEYFGPNSENHLQIYSDGSWNDLPGNYTLVGYICEYERPASTTANTKVAQYLGPETGAITESSLTFGLANKAQAARVTVHWPSGLKSILENVAGNRTIQIYEADELPLPRPTEEGDVIAWGANPNGETTVPSTIGKTVQIVAGDASSAALSTNGTVSVWGTNWAGQRNVPTTMSNVVQIAAGNNHYLALTANGSVVGWGWNTANQTVVPTSLKRAKFIAAGFNTSYAVIGGGSVVAWGGNDVGQANVPTGLVGVTSLAAGRGHAVALKSDGTVVAWGRNDFGQATVPAGLTNVIQVAAGDYHCVALKSNGTVVAWGANWSSQATVPTGLSNAVQISAKGDRSLALKSDNSIVNWGINPDNINPPPSPGQILSIAAGSKHALGLVRKIQIAISGDLPTGTEGQVIPETTFTATGGNGTYTWSTFGTLPPGMTLNATTGKLSGTPLTAGTYTFTVRVSSGGRFSDIPVTIVVQKAVRTAFWVATTGNDTTGNGTVNKPYATIAKAHSMANKGDVIKVLPGTYTESAVIEKAVEISSTAGPSQTILRSASKASAIFFRGAGINGGKLVGFTLTGGGGANNPGYNRYGGGFAISAPAGTTYEVVNCIIRNNTDAGITFGGGFHVTGGSTLKLTNSLVHSNAAWANGGAALIEGANLIADRCTIVSNTNNGYNRIGGISAAGNCNIQIKNSILWSNTTNQYGSFSSGPAGNGTFSFSYSIVQGGTSATVGGNTKTIVNTGTGVLSSDPKFSDTTNYSLGTGSPAINTGDPNAAKDADGSRADMGWDPTLANQGSVELEQGLIAYYPFNGNSNDESGFGNNAQNYGATLGSDRFGNSQKAYVFNGVSSYLQTPVSSNISNLTICAWFRADSASGERSIVDSDNGGLYGNSLILGFWNGDNTLDVEYHNSHFDSGWSPTTGAWHHAVATYEPGVVTLFIDGALKGRWTYVASTPDGSNFRIGRHNAADPQWFKGSIDDVRIYNRALSTSEVTQLYKQESGQITQDFSYDLMHVNQADAAKYLVSSTNLKRYSEWQSPATTYWGPTTNGLEGQLVYKFPLGGNSTQIWMKANDASWDFFTEPGGSGRGCSMLEASRDGVTWVTLKNSLNPRLWGVDWNYENYLPQELLGGSEIWIRVRMLVESCPNSSYTVAQFGRSTSAATVPVFSIRAKSNLKNMVAVQGGTLPQGSSLAGQSVGSFEIGKFEVTWGEWKTVRAWAAANGYDIGTTGQGTADSHPVRNVSWFDAVKWCNAKSEMEGLTPLYQKSRFAADDGYIKTVYRSGQYSYESGMLELFSIETIPLANGYRLPTEAEWEWAARGGVSSKGYTFSGGNDLNAVGWSKDNSGGGPQSVGQKLPNELGIHDMSGNIYEWSWNASGSLRGLEGGAYGYSSTEVFCRVAYRGQDQAPWLRSLDLGLRLARNAQ